MPQGEGSCVAGRMSNIETIELERLYVYLSCSNVYFSGFSGFMYYMGTVYRMINVNNIPTYHD